MRHTSHIRVDLDAVAGNLRAIRADLGPGTRLCSVVKADAYGLGARRLTRTLVGAGSDRLAVFTPAQAAEIEEVSGAAPIMVLMPVRELPRDPAISRLLAAGRLELTVGSLEQLTALTEIRLGRPLPVHVEVDCGMGRGGVDPRALATLVEGVRLSRSLRLRGVSTHFSSADPETIAVQATRFDAALESIASLLPRTVLIHAASTGPCFSALEQRRDLVRIGLGWTGVLPGDRDGTAARALGLREVVRWTSTIVQVRTVEAGATVGYGSRWTASGDTRIGLVPVGYSDGYPSTLADPADPHRVLVEVRDGRRSVPVLGAVNMDQLVVDLSALDPAERLEGAEVVLISDQSDSQAGLARVAARAGLPPHQLLACLGSNVPRTYLAEGGGERFGTAPAAPIELDRSASAAG